MYGNILARILLNINARFAFLIIAFGNYNYIILFI